MNQVSNKAAQQELALRTSIADYITGQINQNTLKHETAPLGIYPQRDDLFMTRIRVNGGFITAEKLYGIADIMDEVDAGFAHLTTRQDIQIHGIDAGHICNVTSRSAEIGLPFKGGGGNTIRNILVSETSGVNPDECFDVQPYADALWKHMFNYEPAYGLPRKLKIGFASGEYDDLMAQVQDLGFVAIRNESGEPGFRVYGGGGMGRESAVAVKLFDFIPQDQIIRCTLAMTNLFFDHGDRGNRNQARIRFIVKRFGHEEFRKLFLNYYQEAAKTAPKCIPDTTASEIAEYTGSTPEVSGFSLWVKKAVTPTLLGEDIVSVCLYVPGGNLSSQQLRQLAALTKYGAAPCFRLTRTQDLLMPKVRKAALPEIYRILCQELQDIDLTGASFKGHIVSCIGCTVCKIGILDALGIANGVAAELDDLFNEDQEKQAESFPRIVKGLRISGCPNSCAAHPAAKIGVQGSKKKLNDKLEEVGTIYTRQATDPLGTTNEVFMPTAEIPAKIRAMVEESVAANAL